MPGTERSGLGVLEQGLEALKKRDQKTVQKSAPFWGNSHKITYENTQNTAHMPPPAQLMHLPGSLQPRRPTDAESNRTSTFESNLSSSDSDSPANM